MVHKHSSAAIRMGLGIITFITKVNFEHYSIHFISICCPFKTENGECSFFSSFPFLELAPLNPTLGSYAI